MRYRLMYHPPELCRVSGSSPVLNGGFLQPGLRAVLGDQRGLARYDLREVTFDHCRNTGMELLAAAVQQRTVRCILH